MNAGLAAFMGAGLIPAGLIRANMAYARRDMQDRANTFAAYGIRHLTNHDQTGHRTTTPGPWVSPR